MVLYPRDRQFREQKSLLIVTFLFDRSDNIGGCAQVLYRAHGSEHFPSLYF